MISAHWPVYSSSSDETGRARLLRPEEALDIAREEVVRLQRARIVGKAAQIDDHTDFVLLAWETFKAAEFPFDDGPPARPGGRRARCRRPRAGEDHGEEGRHGATALPEGADPPRRGQSRYRGAIDAGRFEYVIDAVDTCSVRRQVDGMAAAKAFMDRLGLTVGRPVPRRGAGPGQRDPAGQGEGGVGGAEAGSAGHTGHGAPGRLREPSGREAEPDAASSREPVRERRRAAVTPAGRPRASGAQPRRGWSLRGPVKGTYSYGDRPARRVLHPGAAGAYRYDRMAGYYSSRVLRVAARGSCRSCTTRGSTAVEMRLIVGTQLSPDRRRGSSRRHPQSGRGACRRRTIGRLDWMPVGTGIPG